MKALRLDAYVIDTLMPDLVGHDHQPGAFLVFLYLWRHACGTGQPHVVCSLREIAEGTGQSKRTIQSALSRLVKRKLITVKRDSSTAVPQYGILRPWASA